MDTSISSHLAIERSGTGLGYSEEEALTDWLRTDDTFLRGDGTRWGHLAIEQDKPIIAECTKEPFFPKKANTTIVKQDGARKWMTVHRVLDANTDEEYDFGRTKAEAMKKGRQIAIDKNTAIRIEVGKRLEAGALIEATIEPKASRPGKWKFRATFKY